MKKKLAVIISVILVVILAVAVFLAIWFGPRASLKRELNVSIPKDAQFVKYEIGFWTIGYELPAWKIKLDPEQYSSFQKTLLNSLSGHSAYSYSEDLDDSYWGRDHYEKTNGFAGYYDSENEFLWVASAMRGKEPSHIKSLTFIHALATLGDDGYYYVSIVVM